MNAGQPLTQQPLRNFAFLVGGSALAQGCMLLASPLLTRLYSPDDFGVVAIFFAIAGVVAPVASLRYHQSISISTDDATAANLVAISLLLLGAICGSLCLFLLYFGNVIVRLTNTPTLGRFLGMIPVAVFFLGMGLIGQAWAIRRQKFKRISLSEVGHSVTSVLVQATLGMAKLSAYGMITGRLLGAFVAACSTGLPLVREVRPLATHVRPNSMWRLAQHHWRFPIIMGPSSLVAVLNRQMPFFLLSIFFNASVVGFYSLTFRVLHLPFAIIAEQIAKMFLSAAIEAKEAGRLALVVESTTAILIRITLPSVAIFAIVAPDVFAIVFGEQWGEAGEYARIMSPIAFLTLSSAHLTHVPMLLQKQGGELTFQTILFCTTTASLYLAGLTGEAALSVSLLSASTTLCWIGFMIWTVRMAGCDMRRILDIVVKEVILAVPFILPVFLVESGIAGNLTSYWTLLFAMTLGLLAILLALLRIRGMLVAHDLYLR
jgi:O-antigen/teichoic acid export membrane protein